MIGIALALSSAQAAAADTLKPNDASGGSGAGSESAEVYYLVVDEHGNEFVIDGVMIDDYVREVVRENQALRSIVLIAGTESSSTWSFELPYEQSRPVQVAQADTESSAAVPARPYNQFSSTDAASPRDEAADVCGPDTTSSQDDGSNDVPDVFSANVSPVQEHRDAVFAQATEPVLGQWMYEPPYGPGRPAQEDASTDVDNAVRAACIEARGWPNFDSTSIANQGSGTNAVAQAEDTLIPEWVAAASGMRIEEKEAPPAFSLTTNGQSIVLIEGKEAPVQVASTTAVSGFYVVVDEEGRTISPEMVAAGSMELAPLAAQLNPMLICVRCATME